MKVLIVDWRKYLLLLPPCHTTVTRLAFIMPVSFSTARLTLVFRSYLKLSGVINGNAETSLAVSCFLRDTKQWRTEEGGVGMFKTPPPEIPKVLQNRAKLNPIVKTVKHF